jgi:hypothetical protein
VRIERIVVGPVVAKRQLLEIAVEGTSGITPAVSLSAIFCLQKINLFREGTNYQSFEN